MSEYQKLMDQIAKLQAEAGAVRDKERGDAIAQAKKIIDAFDLTARELGLSVGRGCTPPPDCR
jgi:H-NS histone family